MMNPLQQFDFNGNDVRVILKDGQPWFVLKDVAHVLEIGHVPALKQRLSDDVVSNYPIVDSLGRTQNATIINEDGLYDVILESRKPEARSFRKWVTSEVIPSIRKHGVYMTPTKAEEFLKNPDTIIKIAEQWKEEQQKRIVAEQKLEEQKPLVGFAQTCLTSDKSLLVREVAKLASKQGVMIGERRLYRKLREWGLILQQRNEPTQRAMEQKLFEIKKGVVQTPDGARDYSTPKVTTKGQMYIINRLQTEKQQGA